MAMSKFAIFVIGKMVSQKSVAESVKSGRETFDYLGIFTSSAKDKFVSGMYVHTYCHCRALLIVRLIGIQHSFSCLSSI